ncbi:MAG: UDP-N-acetylmuramoyl-L-alanine--D-glutamate ligase, partial [Pseudomonadota bacterium]|nr:UDP-N-acetylmuramoyl-L-alanine--D-glutamate ligase [Pseudomonadota bacterium]
MAALRRRFPDKPLTLYCATEEVADASGQSGENLRVIDARPDVHALASHDVVIKSPGISAYKPE